LEASQGIVSLSDGIITLSMSQAQLSLRFGKNNLKLTNGSQKVEGSTAETPTPVNCCGSKLSPMLEEPVY